ncbi:PAS domain-containing protein [Roseomonas xinghualingensis]|uniref:PAS domain-containing protein n=1 Tax=Roseomonas xinghualingensis TaxID=2986475 RepID=UPI0021F15195|nr:PAS domain-containing protein [Roseomonas sp. SXEYE001]MCV4208991.1 PAS domain-containing protein [Roseomonas sp. SXEYE001]
MIHEGFGQATTDEHGRFTGVDCFTCRLLGYDARTLLKRSIQDITHPEDWPSNASLLERLWAHNEPFTVTKRYMRRDGTVVWVQAYVTKLRDVKGRGSLCALLRPVLPEASEAKHDGIAAPSKQHGPLRMRPPQNGWLGRMLH